MRIRTFFLLLLLFLKNTQSRLTIPIAAKDGDDKKCLEHLPIRTPCQTLKFVLQYVLASNETSVDINFIEDRQYLIYELLPIHTKNTQTMYLRLFSKLSDELPVSLTCFNGANSIFDVHGPNLTLEFHNIIFEKCGYAKREVVPAIVVNNTCKVLFYSCTFQDNLSGAFFALNSDVHIESSTFQRNSVRRIYNNFTFKSYMRAFSGGVGILFQNAQRMMSINIFQTLFIRNSVHTFDSKYYVAETQQNAVICGGAMHVTFTGKSTFLTTINISSCHFKANNATFGGGLVIELHGTTLNNKIFVTSTKFTKNNGSQAGGAFLLSLWDYSAKTGLEMVDGVFKDNLSKSGSAMYVFLQSKYSSPQESQEILLFKRLQVIGNSGPVASSVKIASHLFGPRSMGQIPIFEDCDFIKNTNPALNGYASLPSFIVDRVNIIFNGTNKFIGNTYFGAVFFSNSYVDVYGKLHFLENKGLQGGALSIQNSQIVVHPGTDLLFRDNYAVFSGGAINVVTNVVYHVGVLNNPVCFLVYSEDKAPYEWNVNVTFINNSAAVRGPAIFIDSLIMCAWDSYSGKLDFNQALRWKPAFHYEGNVLCSDPSLIKQCRQSTNDTTAHDISTMVSSLYERNGMQSIETCPGEEAFLDIIGKDELNNSVFTVIADKIVNSNATFPPWLNSPETYSAIVPDLKSPVKFQYSYDLSFEMPLNTTAEVYYYDLFSNGRVFTHLTLRPQPCRPGFIQQNGSCVCDKSKTAVLGCTQDGLYVLYKEGYWVGLVDGVFTTLPCPFGYCSCPNLPSHYGTATSGCFFNASNAIDQSTVCANMRTGPLCGDCQENHTVGIQTFHCVPQEQQTACIWSNVFSFLITIILCVIILYFNPGLDNELRGPLFFFQVLPLFFPPLQYSSKSGIINVYNVVFFLASIFDFTIPFFGYFFSKCYIVDDLDNLNMLAWRFSSPIIAAIVFLVALLLSYKRVILIRRKNAVQCFWVLLIFMYSSLVSTSLRIVDCIFIQEEYHLFLQASIICYQDRHLLFSIAAYMLLLCATLIPIFIVVFTTTNRLRIAPHYLDTLTNNLKEERLYWWSVDLLRRFLIVALGVFIHMWKDKQAALIIATTFILSIHSYCQPYEETRANITEIIFLFVLCGLGIFQLLDISDVDRDRTNFAVVSIVLLYTLILVIIKLVVFIQQRTRFSIDNEEYERIEGNPSPPVAPLKTAAETDQSLKERREKLAFLFARSESPRDEGTAN